MQKKSLPTKSSGETLSAANFAVISDGDLLVPFGDFPQVVTLRGRALQDAQAAGMRVGPDGRAVIIQRVDAAAGNTMAAEMASLWGNAKRFFLGAPVYDGHPFHPEVERRKEYPSKRALGWIKELIVDEDAIRMPVKWNSLGQNVVNDAQLAYHSPQWELAFLGAENGMGIYRPVRLSSSGLTNEPNIPVPALVAANIAAEMEPGQTDLASQILARVANAEGLDFPPLAARLRTILSEAANEAETSAALGTLLEELPELARTANASAETLQAWTEILSAVAASGMEEEEEPAEEISNEPETEPKPETDMLKKIIEALVAAGIIQAADSEDDVLVRLGSLKDEMGWRRDELARQKARADQLRATLPAANVAEISSEDGLSDELMTTAANEIATARASLAAMTAAMAERLVDGLLADGTVTGANVATVTQELTALPDAAAMQAHCTELRQRTAAAATLVSAELPGAKAAVLVANDRGARDTERAALVARHTQTLARGQEVTAKIHSAAWAAARMERPDLF